MRIKRAGIGVTPPTAPFRPHRGGGRDHRGGAPRRRARPCSSLTERFDHAELGPEQLRVDPHELEASVGVLEPDVLDGLRTAISERTRRGEGAARDDPVAVDACSRATRWRSSELPVRRAAIYVPGGRAPYPSTVVMGAVTARAAGVEQIVVCAPPGPGGRAHPVILAACVLCEVTEVYRMGGAQAIAVLAFGTECDRAGRRDRRPRERVRAGGEAPARLRPRSASTASPGRASLRWSPTARARTPS